MTDIHSNVAPPVRPPAFSRFIATGFIRAYAPLRRAMLQRLDPVRAQQEVLIGLVRKAFATKFGEDHKFLSIVTVADYQERVPLRRYDELWDAYWRHGFPELVDITWPGRMPFFAVSSGTSTGKVKYIPCSDAMVASNKRAALDTIVHHLGHKPKSDLFGGSFFVLGGSTDLVEQAPGIRSGDISGIAAFRQPWWSKPFAYPPNEIRYLTDWEEKLARMAPGSLGHAIKGVSGSPAWMLVLFERLAELVPESGGKLAKIYPELELVVHGGVSFAPYRRRFMDLLEGSDALLREVYAASEGYVSIADRGDGEGMRLSLDNGMFFEFVPLEELGKANPTRHWVGNLETGVDYAIALTTCAGLWSYLIGDVVRFVDRDPPRLLITGRTSYMLSSFGEHVTGELVETCVLEAARAIEADVAEFTVGVEFDTDQGSWGRHSYVVEFDGMIEDAARLDRFVAVIDDELGRRNEDYRERRVVERGLARPRLRAVPPGTFKAWMRSIGKYGGQNKVPRVVREASMLDDIVRSGETAEG